MYQTVNCNTCERRRCGCRIPYPIPFPARNPCLSTCGCYGYWSLAQ